MPTILDARRVMVPGGQAQAAYVGAARVANLWRNLATNPSAETASGTQAVRTNQATHTLGIAASAATPTQFGAFSGRAFGTGGAGAYTLLTGQGDGPLPGVTQYLRKTWSAASTTVANTGVDLSTPPTTGTSTNGFAVTAADPLAISVYVRSNAARTVAIQAYFHDASGAYLSNINGPDTAVPANTWTRVSGTMTVPANATTFGVAADVDTGALWAAGDTLDITAVVLEKMAVVLPYFNGGYQAAPDPDLSAAWVAGVNASASTLSGAKPAGVNTSLLHGVGVLSTAWAERGSKSLRIIATGSGNDQFVDISPMLTGGAALAGRTVTIYGRLRLSAALAGSLSATWGRFRVSMLGPGEITGSLVYSQTPTNAPGVWDVRATLPIPAGTTGWGFVRLYLGAAPGSGDAWWDAITVVPEPYTGPSFDGASDPAHNEWVGPVNASASTRWAAG